ncbi:MAG TPA: LapA family protein [Pelomicrobium sp.]|nr:LapA family protein [Pelomicrobium sp.]
MRFVSWTLRILLFLLLLTFALQNTEDVTVRYYLGIEWRAPLALVIFAFFLAGAVIGVLAAAAGRFGRRRRQRQQAKQAGPSAAAEKPASPALPPAGPGV